MSPQALASGCWKLMAVVVKMFGEAPSQRPTVTPGNHLPLGKMSIRQPVGQNLPVTVLLRRFERKSRTLQTVTLKMHVSKFHYCWIFHDTENWLQTKEITDYCCSTFCATGATSRSHTQPTHLYLATGGCIISNMADNS